MSEEFFDLVNERDEVTGRAPRREVHARGLWHRAIHVLVFDAAGRVFLQKRSMRKDSSPGLWDSSCSGHVDSGEDYDAAAQRELGEEIGLYLAAPPARWFRIEACAETGWEFVWVYRLQHAGPFVLHPEEIERGDWFAPGELARLLAAQPAEFAPSFRLIWKRVAIDLK
jgi:isopentenyl-diphosphate delta-isomerase